MYFVNLFPWNACVNFSILQWLFSWNDALFVTYTFEIGIVVDVAAVASGDVSYVFAADALVAAAHGYVTADVAGGSAAGVVAVDVNRIFKPKSGGNEAGGIVCFGIRLQQKWHSRPGTNDYSTLYFYIIPIIFLTAK